jgi:hypothetical protein
MSRFAIGERVEGASDGHEAGIVCAVFPTVDGNFRYAVDMEGDGALQFFNEENSSSASTGSVRNRQVPDRKRNRSVGKLPSILDDRQVIALRKLIQDFASFQTRRVDRQRERQPARHPVGQVARTNEHENSRSQLILNRRPRN